MKTFEYSDRKFTPCPYDLLTEKGDRIYLNDPDCVKCRYNHGIKKSPYCKNIHIKFFRCSYDEAGGVR